MPMDTDNYAFAFGKDTQVACIWYAEDHACRLGNITMALYRDPPAFAGAAAPWVCRVRSRQYVDDRTFGSKDKRAGWTVTIPLDEPLDATIATMDGIIVELARVFGPDPYIERVDVHAGGAAAFEALTKRRWFHFKFAGAHRA